MGLCRVPPFLASITAVTRFDWLPPVGIPTAEAWSHRQTYLTFFIRRKGKAMRRRSDNNNHSINGGNNNDGSNEDERDHSEWSTLPQGPLHEGLEIEVDPAMTNAEHRRRQQYQQRPALDNSMEDVDLSTSSSLRNVVHTVELSPRQSRVPINEATVMNNDEPSVAFRMRRGDLQSFRKKLFGQGTMHNNDEEQEHFLPGGNRSNGGTSPLTAPLSSAADSDASFTFWDRPSTGLSPPSSRVASPLSANGAGPSWTRTTNGYVEQDFGSSGNGGSGNGGSGSNGADRRRPRSPSPKGGSPWTNPLNLSLFASNLFSSAAESVPVSLVPTIGAALSAGDASSFASRAAASAVLGTSFGKFVNGPAGDIFGARRVAYMYSILLGASLLVLSLCTSEGAAIAACALVEFFSSVQQPCVVIVLAAHYRDDDASCNDDEIEPLDEHGTEDANTSRIWNDVEQHGGSTLREPKAEGRYEAGIYVASLGSRFGSLLAIPMSAILLNSGWGWRTAARLASLSAFASAAVLYLLISDSPGKVNDPQNPIRPSTIMAVKSRHRLGGSTLFEILPRPSWVNRVHQWTSIAWCVFVTNIVPSLRSVLASGTFWIVAISHSGGSMIRTSERILGTYIRDTSGGTISEDKAGSFTIFLSLGMFFGLAAGGSIFTQTAQQPRKRKQIVVRLYGLAVVMCYSLSFLAAPFVRALLWSPTVVMVLQIVATFAMGAGVAVQYYQIPAIVGATFRTNKGLYSAYTDGVAYGVSSMIWRIVGGAVAEGNPEGGGWAYGWAAVALLVVLCGVLMVEFVEHYFCKGGWKNRMERAASKAETAKKKKDDDDSESGLQGNFLRRRFGVGSSPLASIAPPSPRRRLQVFPNINGNQISPMKFLENIGPLRSKSALDEAEEEDDDVKAFRCDGKDNDSDEDSTILFDSIAGPITFDDDDALFGATSPTCHRSNSGKPKTIEEDLRDRVHRQLARPENQVCADCTSRCPRWVSIFVGTDNEPIGCFCCHDCVAFHRQLGTHVVFVRSVDHDKFREKDVNALEAGGNTKVNTLLEATLYRDGMKPGPNATPRMRAQFTRAKYEERRWSHGNATISGQPNIVVDDLLGLSQCEPSHSPYAIELVQSYDLSVLAGDDDDGNNAQPTEHISGHQPRYPISSEELITL